MDRFPILPLMHINDERAVAAAGLSGLKSIPWEMIAPHERQADQNHGQTLERLAQRSGLSACEMIAVLEDRDYEYMPLVDAYKKLDQMVRDYIPQKL